MTYGEPLSTSIPAVGAAGTGYATDINARLAEIETVLESRVPYSSLTGSELDLLGVPVVNAEYVHLEEGAQEPAFDVGSLARYQNNLYWVTDEGAVRITVNGALDSSSIGGIGGDYGGANPSLVTFDEGTSQYRFYENFNTLTWGHLTTNSIYIADSTTTTTDFVRLVCPPLTASYTLTLPNGVPAATSMLVINSAGNITYNRAGFECDTILLNTNENVVLTGTGKVAHPDRRFYVGLGSVLTSTGVHTPNPGFVISGTAGVFYVAVHGWQENYRIKGIRAHVLKGDTATTQFDVEIWNSASVNATVVTATSTTSGTVEVSGSAGSPVVVTSTDSLWIKVTAAANSDRVYAIELTYDVENN